jgi:hypothetical protein
MESEPFEVPLTEGGRVRLSFLASSLVDDVPPEYDLVKITGNVPGLVEGVYRVDRERRCFVRVEETTAAPS